MGGTKEVAILTPREKIKHYLDTHRAPVRGLIIDIVEYRDRMALRFYRDDFNMIPDLKQLSMVEWLETVVKDLNLQNDFVVTIEMEAEVPNAV
jgi:hypothetical protein